MPRVRFFEPGHNGDLTPLDFIATAHEELAFSRSFQDEHRARLLPIHAQLDAEKALKILEAMDAGMWKLITAAEVSIALRAAGSTKADRALESMLAEAEAEVYETERAAVFAEVASALLLAGRGDEAAAWLSRAGEHIEQENNPFETVMGIARHHLHRGDHAAAVAAFRSRPGGYSSHITAFHLPFLDTLLSGLSQAGRDDLVPELIGGITENHERYQVLSRYITLRLKAGHPEAAMAAQEHLSSYTNEALELVAAHAWEARDLDLLRGVIARGREKGNPDYIGSFTYWPKWEARYDVEAARASLAPLLERGLDPKNCWSGLLWQLSQILQGIAAIDGLPAALVHLPLFRGDDYALRTLEAIGRSAIAVGDADRLQGVVDALCASEQEVSEYDVPAEAFAGKLLLEAGRRSDGLALLEALHKQTRGTRRFIVLSQVRCEAGDLPGAVKSAKKVANRGSRDRALKPIALAYGRAGDMAGALKVMGEIKERRERGFVATEILEHWAEQQGLYRYTPIH